MKIKSTLKPYILVFFLGIFVMSCKISQKEKPISKKNPIELSMDRHADSLLLDTTINAISIGIYKDGKTYIQHYGELDKGKGNKPTNETIYEIG